MNMNKTIGFLFLLLLVQIILAGTLLFSSPDLSAVRPDTPLIALKDRKPDRLIIEGAEGDKTVLQKEGDTWILPEHYRFPVEKGKVDSFLAQLQGLQHGHPVATTSATLARFRLTDEAFERRITLARGKETLETIYLGSSPGVRQIHARTAEDTTVYSVPFSAYQAPAKPEDWEDKALLSFPPEDIREIQVAGLTIQRNPSGQTGESAPRPNDPASAPPVWFAEGLAEGESLDQAGVAELVRRMAELRIARVLGTQSKPEYGLDNPALTIRFNRKEAGSVEYRLSKPQPDTNLVLGTSHRSEYFGLHNYVGRPLMEAANRDKLVTRGKKEEKEEADSS
uniref:DUF4340 domain-containing protein n=1 Tax=Candidatus Kentrum sp. DK TaxID=2126562 RepID=A0A450SHP5_9GAMM|nr:MAG: protein of unknown function (DUF4340) [Candidatus Kentron sp. DK]